MPENEEIIMPLDGAILVASMTITYLDGEGYRIYTSTPSSHQTGSPYKSLKEALSKIPRALNSTVAAAE